jgi:hypothetical protein
MPEPFVVRGRITDTQQRSVAGVIVLAFDRDLPSLNSDEALGQATTGGEGDYAITFEEDRFRAKERGRADLYIEVRGVDGALLGRSPTRFNPERDETIDLTIVRPPAARLSEYEQLVALLQPLVEPLAFAELTIEDAAFLVQDTRAERSHVSWLLAAARLARQTAVPAEAFYGWARHEPPLPYEWSRVPDTKEAEALTKLREAILARLTATRSSPRSSATRSTTSFATSFGRRSCRTRPSAACVTRTLARRSWTPWSGSSTSIRVAASRRSAARPRVRTDSSLSTSARCSAVLCQHHAHCAWPFSTRPATTRHRRTCASPLISAG